MADTRKRVNDSILQPLERPLLDWLVCRIPHQVKPDHLTWLGLLGAMVTLIGYLLSQLSASFLWLASFGLLVHWFGDSLDGNLARYRNTPRYRYGSFVDHSADLFAQILIGAGLGTSGYFRIEVTCFGLIAFLAMTSFVFIRELATGSLQITFLRMGATEIRCAIVVLNAVLFLFPPRVVAVLWAPMTGADLLIIGASIVMLVIVGFSAIGEARRLSIEDP